MLGAELLKLFGGSAGGSGSSNVNLLDASVAGQTYAQWTIGYDGFTYKRKTSGAAVKSLDWINPQSGMDQYDVRATVASGDIPPGTIGAWLNLSASSTWGWTAQTVEKSCNLTIEIRRVSDLVVVDSATISLFVAGTV